MTEKSYGGSDVVLGDNVKILRIECAGGGGRAPTPYWIIILFALLFCIFTPIFIYVTITIWIESPKIELAEEIRACAGEGSLHPSLRSGPNSDQWLDGFSADHPDGLCKDVKKIIHQSVHYCKDCGDEPPKRAEYPLPFPLALGGDRVMIEVEDGPPGRAPGSTETFEGCMTPVIGIEVTSDLTDNNPNEPNRKKKTTYREEDLDLPPFCAVKDSNPSQVYWALLDRPRSYFTRTYEKDPDLIPTKQGRGARPEAVTSESVLTDHEPPEVSLPVQTGAPYAVFIARQWGNPDLIKVFVLYVDFVSERPVIIEIPFETLIGRKAAIGPDNKIHVVNNVKLDSIGKRLTFQIGFGVEEIAIAGYDFGPQSTNTQTARRNRDASGSYTVCLSDSGTVTHVYRQDLVGVGVDDCPA